MFGLSSPLHWIIVLLIVVLIFGTKKLRNIGSDVGGAVKNFKDAMNEEKGSADATVLNTIKSDTTSNLIEAEVVEVPATKAAPKKRVAAVKKDATPKAAVAKTKAAPAKKSAVSKPKATASAAASSAKAK